MKYILTTAALVLLASWASAATVNLNVIQVCDDGGSFCAPVNLNQSFTDKIWAQAGTTFNYGSITQLNSTQYLNPTQAQADQLIDSNVLSGTGRALFSYDVWFVNSFSGAAGLRGLGALGGDGVVISSSSAAVDTFAHELGHNFGQDHTDGTIIDADRYLMAEGSIRTIPTGVGDIAPDGLQLDRFDPILPEVTVDMIGATPFQSSNFFDVKFLAGAATDLGLSSLTIDLTPANAFFDITDAPPGVAGSPFNFGSLVGVSATDIAISGLSDGGSILEMAFAADSFTSGDSLSFGLDMDLFSNIDGFGATADELRSSLVTLAFENGYSVAGDLSTLIFSSVFDPNRYVDVFTSRRGDPLATPVPEPSSACLLILGLATIGAFRGAKARSSRMAARKLCLTLAAGIWLAANPAAFASDAATPGRTVDKNSGVLADPDWIPCTRDPSRNRLKHCSEEYRLCREAGNSSVACLAVDYPVLTPATKPSQDEYFSCRSAGHDEAKCVDILGAPIK